MSVFAAVAALTACNAANAGAPAASASLGQASAVSASPVLPGSAATWSYEVAIGKDGRELAIEATLASDGSGLQIGDAAAMAYVRDLAVETGGVWQSLARQGAIFPAAACGPSGCRIRYTYDIARAAADLDDQDLATDLGGMYEAPPSTWLVHPVHGPDGVRIRFHVTTRDGALFATGIPAVDDTYEGSAADLLDGPYAVMGNCRVRHTDIPGGGVDVAMSKQPFAMSEDEVSTWAREAATNLARYYGAFPAKKVLVIVAPDRGTSVNGMTMGSGGAAILMRVGTKLTAAAARDNWVLTHELVHTSFPTLGRQHAWMEEGLATYLEPIIRARVGVVGVERFWRDLVEGLPQGLPQQGDRGLERTRTWGRTYWGGALFWLLADIAIREATDNRRSLDDALRAIAATGASVLTEWPIERVVSVADESIGKPVVRELYDRLALAPGQTDLPKLWARLGVRVTGGAVVFDDKAPLAAIRKAIPKGAAPPP